MSEAQESSGGTPMVSDEYALKQLDSNAKQPVRYKQISQDTGTTT